MTIFDVKGVKRFRTLKNVVEDNRDRSPEKTDFAHQSPRSEMKSNSNFKRSYVTCTNAS